MDNLELLKQLPDNYIDLIYCDILYGTGRNFGDYQDLKCDRKIIEEHYIPRVKEMKRVLKDTGSIYLQMDTRINHWIRCIMDDVFGYDNFRNEIIWNYETYSGSVKNYFPRKHDNILFYSKTEQYFFKLQYFDNSEDSINFKRWKAYIVDGNKIMGANYPKTDSRFTVRLDKWIRDNGREPKADDVIFEIRSFAVSSTWKDINAVDPKDLKEKLDYITQKPKALLERIIKASSNENDIVADFYMGSGTSMAVAKELNRQFIGCDISQKAVDITNQRLVEIININKLF
jgi:DNA modification methylase